MEITRQKLIFALSGGFLVVAVLLYSLFYQPLMKELNEKRTACSSIEKQVKDSRETLQSLTAMGQKGLLIHDDDVSFAIDALAKKGKEQNIAFLSITSKEIERGGAEEYRILPVETKLKGSYESLGLFFGFLTKLEQGLVTVKKFSIVPVTGDPQTLNTKLTLNLYLKNSHDR